MMSSSSPGVCGVVGEILHSGFRNMNPYLTMHSQYPNYFGDCLFWTGIATFSFGTVLSDQFQETVGFPAGVSGMLVCFLVSYSSPAFVATLLFRISGANLSEEKYDEQHKDHKAYQEWKKNTPKCFPRLRSS